MLTGMPTTLPDHRYRMVVALDLSEYAEIVLEHALDQAARHSAPDLHFLTVVPNEAAVAGTKEQLAELVLEGLDVFRDRSPDWHARLHVRAGKPDEEIVNLAAEVQAQLVVVGRFGLHHPRRKLGSVAHRVLEAAPCPTLAVGLVDQPVELHRQCPDCVTVRAESDGERWFCDAHRAADRVTLATTMLPSVWTGGTLMW
jgi:nucleotide-binding universal stress UspA family protein